MIWTIHAGVSMAPTAWWRVNLIQYVDKLIFFGADIVFSAFWVTISRYFQPKHTLSSQHIVWRSGVDELAVWRREGGDIRRHDMSWTDERVELLKKYWAEGLSASQIAKRLGDVTRNAVIGKVHRLGLSGRATPARPERGRAPTRVKQEPSPGRSFYRAAQEEVEVIEEPVFMAPLVLKDGEMATVSTIKSGMCKWPVGDPASDEFHFCGQGSTAGQSYCPYHAHLAYQPAQKKKRRRDDRVREVAPLQRRAANF